MPSPGSVNPYQSEELIYILQEHAARYPKMQPADAVKLIYQNEFGGGHMIRDEAGCMLFLRQEYASVENDMPAPLYESIGNGILRINLAAVAEEDLEELGRRFIRSAAAHTGSMDRFLSKLAVLEDLTRRGIFSFSSRDLSAYLADYRQAGYPAVSHSTVYREAYKPAYRVICK